MSTRVKRASSRACGWLLLLTCVSALSQAAEPRIDATGLAHPEAGEWLTTGRTYDEQRFSPLPQIDAGTVQRLGLTAYYDIPTSFGQEATPLVAGERLYVATDWSIVKAFDARTGRLLWSFDPHVKQALVKGCCGPVNRGVALWQDKVFVGALDGRLIALDAKSGAVVWQTVTADQRQPYTITGAPRVVEGLVIIGNAGADVGVRGYVSAYHANTGALVWRFYTVPGKPGVADNAASDKAMRDIAAKTWFGEYWKLGGGGTVWDSMAYDPKLGLLYVGTGNGSPWNHAVRSDGRGDNLFLSSIIALRARTGEYVWHYQTTPAEAWDFTATQHIILADLDIGGRTRQVLMQAPKNGYFYVLDRATGELLSAQAFVPMTWSTGVDMKTGRPIENPNARYYKTGKPFLMAPSGIGAHNWQPMSYHPQTGLVYIPANQVPVSYLDNRNDRISPLKLNPKTGYGFDPPPAALPAAGWLLAWNPITSKVAWRVPYEVPWNGGVLSTAGNLVFQGNHRGELVAYAADSGARLWSFDAQTGVVAAPITYSIDDEQYVAVLAGWAGSLAMVGGASHGAVGRNRLLIFKLGGTERLPAPAKPLTLLSMPLTAGKPEQVQSGEKLYFGFCSRCHGTAAISGGVLPDLRKSRFLMNEGWYAVVLDGALAANGMASFREVLDRDAATAIRTFVIDRALQDQQDASPNAPTVIRGH